MQRRLEHVSLDSDAALLTVSQQVAYFAPYSEIAQFMCFSNQHSNAVLVFYVNVNGSTSCHAVLHSAL